MRKAVKACIAAGCFAAAAGAVALGHTLKAVHYEVKSEKLSAPVKLAFLSDVHNSLYGKGQSGLIGEIDGFGADIVLFGGDLFDEHNGEENSWALVDALAGRYPCYYTIGNHEMKQGRQDFYKSEMSEHGVTVLSGETCLVEINGQQIRLCGADGLYDTSLGKAEKELDEHYSVLLYHYPEDFPKISDNGFDLILSGHAHGGQWRLPGLINGLYSPDEGFFPKYAGGRYEENGCVMLVSRGLYRNLSCIYLPRIFNNPELLLITLGG